MLISMATYFIFTDWVAIEIVADLPLLLQIFPYCCRFGLLNVLTKQEGIVNKCKILIFFERNTKNKIKWDWTQ